MYVSMIMHMRVILMFIIHNGDITLMFFHRFHNPTLVLDNAVNIFSVVSSKIRNSSIVTLILISSVKFLLVCLSCCTSGSGSYDSFISRKMDLIWKSLDKVYGNPPTLGTYIWSKSNINQEIQVY